MGVIRIRPRHPTPRSWVAGLALTGLLAAACGKPDTTTNEAGVGASERIPLEPGALRDRNLLLVTLDTVRADRLGCYGHAGAHTPRLDALARQGLRFAQAFTAAPSTLPGHASILTGLYPYGHGARANGTFRVESDTTTLAEVLTGSGYRCAAFVAAYVLDARFGLDQGFEHYDDDLSQGRQAATFGFRERPANQLVDACLAWLDGREDTDAPFFAWVHLFDPHAPYAPPEPFASRFAADPYDGEIAWVDRQVGRLLDGVNERAGAGRTLVVVTADHGESLGEHGELQHSLFLYDATMHVPLLMDLGCDDARGVVVERQVGTVDLVPTLLELLGIGYAHPLHGTSLLQPTTRDTHYMETLAPLVQHGWSPLFALRGHDAKLIRAPRPELYELDTDPGEITNRIEDPTLARKLGHLAAALEAHLAQDAGAAPSLRVDASAARELAALGYISTLEPGSDAGGERRDPKDMVPIFERGQRALGLLQAGAVAPALAELEACLAASPLDTWLLQLAASACRDAGRLTEARAHGDRALELAPGDPAVQLLAAELRWASGERTAAREHLEEVLRLDPRNGHAHALTGTLLAEEGRIAEAITWFERAREHDPGGVGADASHAVGVLNAQIGRDRAARRAWRRAIELDRGHVAAHSALARSLAQEGRAAEARAVLEQALRWTPESPSLRLQLEELPLAPGRHVTDPAPAAPAEDS